MTRHFTARITPKRSEDKCPNTYMNVHSTMMIHVARCPPAEGLSTQKVEHCLPITQNEVLTQATTGVCPESVTSKLLTKDYMKPFMGLPWRSSG